MSEPARYSFDWKLDLWPRLLILFGCPVTFICRMEGESSVTVRCGGALLTFGCKQLPPSPEHGDESKAP